MVGNGVARNVEWLRRQLALRVCELGLVPDPRIRGPLTPATPENLARLVAQSRKGGSHGGFARRPRQMTAIEVDEVLYAYTRMVRDGD